MPWKFSADEPIYQQIMKRFRNDIACGILKPGDRVPPVRELAIDAGVNPNTMQRALAGLEAEGILRTERTSGRYVADVRDGMRDALAQERTDEFIKDMKALGLDKDGVMALIEERMK